MRREEESGPARSNYSAPNISLRSEINLQVSHFESLTGVGPEITSIKSCNLSCNPSGFLIIGNQELFKSKEKPEYGSPEGFFGDQTRRPITETFRGSPETGFSSAKA